MAERKREPVTHRALVTGASRGIGASIAKVLAQEGCRVILNYRSNHERAREVEREIREAGGTVELACFDVGDPAAVTAAYRQLKVEEDPIDVLVNNAGQAKDGPFAGMKPGDWEPVIRTCLFGFYNVTQPLTLPMVRGRWGRIITIVSRSGTSGQRGQVNYSAAKAALIGATKALAKELATRGITVNAVCPGLIDTDMLKGLDHEKLTRQIPLGRLGTAAEVAEAIRFLLGRGADYITGQVLAVDGGLGM